MLTLEVMTYTAFEPNFHINCVLSGSFPNFEIFPTFAQTKSLRFVQSRLLATTL